MTRWSWLLVGVCAVGCGVDAPALEVGETSAAVTVTNLAGGVVAANHPAGAGQYGVWYDAADNTFGTPVASTLAGAPAMRIDDGGFANGVYAIFPSAIPSAGTWRLQVTVQVVESGAIDAIDAYQIGAAVGAAAAHRGPNPSLLPALAVSGAYPGLTNGNDTALGPQLVTTSDFVAAAGDDLLVAFGTDVGSGTWTQGSQTWGGSHVIVGDVELLPVAVDPLLVVDNDDGAPAYTETGAWSQGGSTGYAAGTYRFASAGNAASASWSTALEPGFWEVQAIWRAGANRAAQASYSVTIDGAPALAKTVDQRFQDLTWVKLGLVEATAAGTATVTLDAAASAPAGQVVIADAVRFVPSEGPPPVDPPEIRLAAITVFDPIADVGAIQTTIDRLVDLHYNAVAIHTRYRGDATYFPNKVVATHPNSEPRSPQAGSVDVLEEYVTRGHAAGLRVFAYVNTHLVTSGVDAVANPAHVVNVHPEWRTWAYRQGAPAVQTVADDSEGLWLEPALPAVREYLVDVVGDIADNYAIDGVILDRIRYPQTTFTRPNRDFGYHPDAVASFNFWYGKSGTPDPYDTDWIEFRQRAITRTVDAIHDELEAIDPQLLLLAYPLGRFTDAREFAYQDWPTWLRDRHIDGVLPQIYNTDLGAFSGSLAQHRAAYGGDRLVGVTLNAFTAGVDLPAQMELARAQGFDGSSPFRHGVMDALGYNEAIAEPWNGIAPFPATPWKGADVLDLSLRPSCDAPAPAVRRWRVHNDNAWAVEIEWWSVGTGEHGVAFAAPGDSFFETKSPKGIGVVLLGWRDEDEHPRVATQVAIGGWCVPQP